MSAVCPHIGSGGGSGDIALIFRLNRQCGGDIFKRIYNNTLAGFINTDDGGWESFWEMALAPARDQRQNHGECRLRCR